jgi:hypothetical protein
VPMGTVELFYLAASLVCGIAATVGWAVVALSPADFRRAKVCFWIAGISFYSIGVVWPAMSDAMMITRILVAGTMGFISAAGLAEALHWLNKREVAVVATMTPSGPLAGLTNAQLRERTMQFAAEIRDFEAAHTQQERRLMDQDWARRDQGPARPSAYSTNLLERSAQYQGAFNKRYRSEAVTLRDELKKRLNGLPTFPTTSPLGRIVAVAGVQIFEGSTLAGAGPISSGADLLEFWANQLP